MIYLMPLSVRMMPLGVLVIGIGFILVGILIFIAIICIHICPGYTIQRLSPLNVQEPPVAGNRIFHKTDACLL